MTRLYSIGAMSMLALLATSVAATSAEWVLPTETARPCPRYGPGFVQVPGSTTCLRIGGQVRAEVGASSRTNARDRITGSGVSARVSSDTRTETGYGTLRSYIRVRASDSRN